MARRRREGEDSTTEVSSMEAEAHGDAAHAVAGLQMDTQLGVPKSEEELVEELHEAFDAPIAEHAPEWRPSPGGWIARRATMFALFGVIAILPLLFDPVNTNLVALAFIFVIIGLSINILMGYLGQISLGHNAFVGVGAFTSAYVVSVSHLSFWVAIVVGGLSGAVSAILLGFIALRLRGLFLALITLAYGTVARLTIFNLPQFTGGGAGRDAPRPPGFTATSNVPYTYLCLGVLVLLMYVDWRIVKSKVGRAIFAIRENEIAAASFGINVTAYKLIAFVASGFFAGLGGSLYAHQQTAVSAGNFDFALALTFVLMVVVGGLNSRVGVFIGSAFFAVFQPILANISVTLSQWSGLIGALLLLLTLVQFPGGIAQQISPLLRWFRGGKLRGGHKAQVVATGGAGVRP